MIGKVVKIIKASSIAGAFIGKHGVITGKSYNDKWIVEFISKTNTKGSLSHTVVEDDFVIMEVSCEDRF